MAQIDWKKIFRGILIGGGTVLSLFAPAVGAPLVVAGMGVDTGPGTSNDLVTTYGHNLAGAIDSAAAMRSASTRARFTLFTDWLLTNWWIPALVIVALVFLPKLKLRLR